MSSIKPSKRDTEQSFEQTIEQSNPSHDGGMKPKTLTELQAFLTSHFMVTEQWPGKQLNNEIERVKQEAFVLGEMSIDSREINAKDVFIALHGIKNHGLDFLQAVLQNSVAVILSDRALTEVEQDLVKQQSSPPLVLIMSGLSDELGSIASWFYDYPSQKLKVVGITGTNGKTSTAFFTAQLLSSIKQNVALMGTLGNGPLGALQKTHNTTPDAVSVQRLLNKFVNQEMAWCIMEVSSHALSLGRVQGVEFETVAMTQITRDHIDFHGSELAYQSAKKRLFSDYSSQHKILNVADKTGQAIFQELVAKQIDESDLSTAEVNNTKENKTLIAYNALVENSNTQLNVTHNDKPNVNENTNNNTAEQAAERMQLASLSEPLSIQAKRLEFSANGIHCEYAVNHETAQFDVPLLGAFNIENCFCALSILLASGFNLERINQAIPSLQSVQGRMQLIHQEPTALVDFAHTPDALQQVLQAVQTHLSEHASKLIVVFGCGGDRDKGKRPLMGAVAENFSDTVILTNDNPRTEEPSAIIDEILAGMKASNKVQVIEDRAAAIIHAMNKAGPEDIVVIAGKGHEDYQEIAGIKHPFRDEQVVHDWHRAKLASEQ